MTFEAENPPGHLSRMPYEILKLIVAEVSTYTGAVSHNTLTRGVQLNQKDQISLSKTCILLWRLAYPMAYNRITVKIGPGRKDSEWQDLASGVGRRYVRHLEIQSLYGNEKKPRNVEDLAAGTLTAAIRRNQLLSFRYGSWSLREIFTDMSLACAHHSLQRSRYRVRR
jgi:hypothetical protein